MANWKLRELALPDLYRGGPSGVIIAGWLLRLAVLGYAIGIVFATLAKPGSGLGAYFLEWGFTHPQTALVERMLACGLLALALAALIRPHWIVLLPIASLVALEAVAIHLNAGAPFAGLAPFAHALRYGAPIALTALYAAPLASRLGRERHLNATAWFLRIAIATVFVTHGLEALMQHPKFVAYIVGTTRNFTGHALAEATAIQIMRGIGVLDIAVAVLLLVRPHPAVLYWMALWGLITALARVTTFGIGHHHEVLVRSAHFLAPLAMLFILRALTQIRESAHDAPEPAP